MSQRQQLERIMIVDLQIRSGLFPNAQRLAQDLEVSRRVLYMDRQFMIDRLHAPIGYDRRRKGWYYTDETWMLPSIMITEGELLALVLGVEAARTLVGTALEGPLLTAMGKIENSLHGPVGVDMESLREYCTFDRPAALAVNRELLSCALNGVRGRQSMRICYHGAESNEQTQRAVDPYGLHHVHGEWYLFGFDHLRGAIRTFNLGRVLKWEPLSQRFERDPAFDVEQWRASLFGAEGSDEMLDVVIRFDAYQAVHIRGRLWHRTQQIEELADGGLILRFSTSARGEVVRFALRYGSHAEVLAPAELREEIASEVGRMADSYSRRRARASRGNQVKKTHRPDELRREVKTNAA